MRKGFGLLLFVAAAAGAAQGPPRNVVIIGIDTLRADHHGCYGYSKPTTPAIDAFAAEATLFADAMVPRGLTIPSLVSLMTSQYPVSHGVRINSTKIPPQLLTLAEILTAKGFVCGAFTANPLVAEHTWEGFAVHGKGDDAGVTRQALEWMEANRTGPFFLWAFYYAPHKPYVPPLEYGRLFDPQYETVVDPAAQDEELENITLNQTTLNESELAKTIALYDGEVAFADEQVGAILRGIDTLGLRDDTLVVLVADHGEELYDHFRYFYHIASIHDAVLHVPLVFRLPGHVPEAQRICGVIESLDIAPTVLDFLGIPAPQGFQGSSLRHAIESGKTTPRPAVAEVEQWMLSVRTDRYRLILNPTGRPRPWIDNTARRGREGLTELHYEKEELYDVVEDLREQRNVAAERKATVEELTCVANEWRKRHHWELGAETSALDEELLEKAKALGYLN